MGGHLSQPAIDYACRDADATLRLYHQLYPRLKAEGLEEVYRTVMATLPLLLEMQRVGWRIDTTHLTHLHGRFNREQRRIEDAIAEMGFGGLNANSSLQVGAVLFDELGLEVKARTKLTKRPSTNDKHLQALIGEHPLVRMICDIRELVKLKSIIAQILAFTRMEGTWGRLYPRLNPCGTPTGRLACNDPSLLAIPKHSARGKQIRKAFLPPEGMELWSWDLSQIELRVLAIDSEEPALVQAFTDGVDIHTATAKRMFGDAYTKKDRFAAKAVNFGIPMGISEKGLTEQMHKQGLLQHTDHDSRAWLAGWHHAYPVASRWLTDRVDLCRHTGYVSCLGGRRRYLPGVRARSAGVRTRSERQCQSFPMQAGAQHIMHQWEAEVFALVVQTGLATPILQIHDDLVLAGPREDFETVDGVMRGLLPTTYCVPIISGEDTRGETWGDFD